jgi:hypothetical protein
MESAVSHIAVLPHSGNAVRPDVVYRLAMQLHADCHTGRPFDSLPHYAQNWSWDRARSLLQGAGFAVATNANWTCPVMSPGNPPNSLRALSKILAEAKERLAGASPEIADAILAADGIVREATEHLSDLVALGEHALGGARVLGVTPDATLGEISRSLADIVGDRDSGKLR